MYVNIIDQKPRNIEGITDDDDKFNLTINTIRLILTMPEFSSSQSSC